MPSLGSRSSFEPPRCSPTRVYHRNQVTFPSKDVYGYKLARQAGSHRANSIGAASSRATCNRFEEWDFCSSPGRLRSLSREADVRETPSYCEWDTTVDPQANDDQRQYVYAFISPATRYDEEYKWKAGPRHGGGSNELGKLTLLRNKLMCH